MAMITKQVPRRKEDAAARYFGARDLVEYTVVDVSLVSEPGKELKEGESPLGRYSKAALRIILK